MTGSSHERAAAAFAAGLAVDDVPEAVRDHARLVLADTVAAMVGGSTDPDLSRFVDDTCGAVPGDASVVGHDTTTSRVYAALANGSVGTVLELDEGHKYAAGHPSIHTLPAALAEAEVADASGDDLLVAFVAGYEVVTRVARACYPLADGYHPHGVWGPVGAAVAVASLRDYDDDTTLQAMRIAANQAQHTLMAAATEGATVRQTFAGMANATGLLAADLAAAGLTGLDDGTGRHLELATADGVDRTELDAALGERWEVTRGYFKRHAACRYTHPTLDALGSLQDANGFDADDVASVRVETYPTAADLDEPRPRNALQAKFSVPFAVATRIVNHTSGKEAFVDDALTDAVIDLADRIAVEATDEMTARLPDERSARVTVTLADGHTLVEEVVTAKGDAERPYTESEIEEKFRELVTPVLGDQRASDLWDACRRGPAAPRALSTHLQP
ncbi:MmgE/PrpD family protein [Halorubellus sp. JP-L1]|uniref:MmgE/PrpD family protein n=1 Tax=Halorubellus sp. JP-L1 TaxID=2715753 RepID=UPI00140E4CCD|nr:MmgE/PrpD family protein [Halorubellus sp. JP-L1]NHN42843.1 MmgE/PrpD family protein [Halorubellus sp. JP-L1]